MNSLTRRDLLRSGILSTAGLGVLSRGSAALAIPPIGRTRPSHLKLSIAAYSYRDLLTAKPPKMDLFDFANLAADMGLDAIEPTSYYFPQDVTTDYLHRLKQHAFLLGLDISSTAIGNNFCLPPGPKRDEQLASTRMWIDRAAELDAPVIRIFAGNVPRGETEEQAVAWAIEGIKESLPYAAKKGVTLALENHGGITATVSQILKLVRAVDATELRREPRHRQLPRRGSLRRDRRTGSLRRDRPGQDRDPPQGRAGQRGSRPVAADLHPPRGPLLRLRHPRIRGRRRSAQGHPAAHQEAARADRLTPAGGRCVRVPPDDTRRKTVQTSESNRFVNHLDSLEPAEVGQLGFEVAVAGDAVETAGPVLPEPGGVAVDLDRDLGPAAPLRLGRVDDRRR